VVPPKPGEGRRGDEREETGNKEEGEDRGESEEPGGEKGEDKGE